MKPAAGVAIEIIALTLALGGSLLVPSGIFYTVYILAAEVMATYLIHCPGHYFVGRAFGIRFSAIRIGRSGLARLLPKRVGRMARLFPVLTLSTDKTSLVAVSKKKVAAMYASGTVASAASAVAIAAFFTVNGASLSSEATWVVALVYLAFDLIFSPRGGDLFRAKNALKVLPV